MINRQTCQTMETSLMVILLFDFVILSKGGNFYLIGSPSTPTDGDLFTLTCGNRSSGSRAVSWYLNDSMAFTTSYEPGQHNDCTLGIQGSSPYRYMAERVTVSCDTHQHNVTLTINSTLDSGSVWFCENNTVSNAAKVTRGKSVKLIINVRTRESTTTSTHGSSTSTTTLETSNSDNRRRDAQNNIYMYIAVGGGGGGGAFIIVCILGVVCLKRRNRHGHLVKEDHPVTENGNMNTALQYDSRDEDIMVENDLYERSSDVISPATQDLGKVDDSQVEGYTAKEVPPAISNGNRSAIFQHDTGDENIMVENHMYVKSSDVTSHTQDLVNTDGVTEYKVKEVLPAISNGNRSVIFQHDSSDEDIMVENHLYVKSSDVTSQSTQDLGNTDGVTDGEVNKANITQPYPVPVIASPDSGDDLL